MMKVYHATTIVVEKKICYYEVDAKNKKEARQKIMDNEGEFLDSGECIEWDIKSIKEIR